MLTLLLNPVVRKIAFGIGAVLIGFLAYTIWASHLRSVGAAAEKAREAAVAIQHEQDVVAKSKAVELGVAQDADPINTLKREWSK